MKIERGDVWHPVDEKPGRFVVILLAADGMVAYAETDPPFVHSHGCVVPEEFFRSRWKLGLSS